MRSPTAEIVGTLVWQYSLTTTKPLLVSTPLLFVAKAGRNRAATDRDQQVLGLDRLAAFERDDDARIGALDALEAGAEFERDAAAAERPLEQLRT